MRSQLCNSKALVTSLVGHGLCLPGSWRRVIPDQVNAYLNTAKLGISIVSIIGLLSLCAWIEELSDTEPATTCVT